MMLKLVVSKQITKKSLLDAKLRLAKLNVKFNDKRTRLRQANAVRSNNWPVLSKLKPNMTPFVNRNLVEAKQTHLTVMLQAV